MSAAEANEATEYPHEVACLLIPMVTVPMLLPNVAVAEIITDAVQPNADTPVWHLGMLNWRSVTIPVVSLEVLNGQPPKFASQQLQLAIINGYRGEKRLPFYAIAVQGIPGLVRVMPGDIDSQVEQTYPYEQLRVMINGQKAMIPNLAMIEDRILSASQ